MQADTTIRVASFNVGTEGDWLNLASRAKWKEKKRDNYPSFNDVKGQQALAEFEKAEGILREQVTKSIATKVDQHLGRLLKDFQPDILCLQEYFYQERLNDNAHKAIKICLETNGYSIVGETKAGSGRIDDLAIAYKRNVFDCKKIGVAFQGGLSEPARFADLKHKTSGIVIRAASDHVSGFDGAQQKKHAEKKESAKAELPARFEDRVRYFQRNERTAHGDVALDTSLHSFETSALIDEVDALIFGLDANTTSKASSQEKKGRLHPKRMRLFELYGYQTDRTNQNPTILDSNENHPRKYDYVCAKNIHRRIQLTVADQIFSGINHPSLLQDPAAVLSDHLPVLSVIKMELR
ncbi:MAG: hypothetical protein LLG04_12130 [Parachlamydia sp.]|nr:hypothetical protein [Parachlamydia sp.]